MAYHLCSSPSSLLHDRQHLTTSPLPPSSILRLRCLPHRPKVNFPSAQLSAAASSPQLAQVAVGEVSTETSDIEVTPVDILPTESQKPVKKVNYVWVNPNSPRASKLRQSSYDARYASLVEVSKALDACDGSYEDVSRVFDGFVDNWIEQDAVVIINNMTNCETAPFVLRYFQGKLRLRREVVLYNVTLKVFRKCKNLPGAEKVFEEMLERNVVPDNVTFSTIISCARMSYLPEKAVEWFEKMSQFGCDPDEVTYSAMIDAYGRAGNVTKALSLYDKARSEKWRIDPVTFSTVIKIHGLSGNFDGCLNVYEEMKAVGVKPNLVLYNTLLDAMGRGKRPWQAKSIYKELISNGLTPSWTTYAALLRAYGRARYAEDALQVYKEMKEKNMNLNIVLYNTLLAMCADVGHAEVALDIIEDMKASGIQPDSWTFSSLITIYSCSGKVAEVEGMLDQMMASGYDPNIFVLTSLIQCYGKANQTDDVVRTFNRCVELGITPDDRFCGCLLNVLTQTPKEELGKLTTCIETANPKLGLVVRQLVGEQVDGGDFIKDASELINSVDNEVKKAYCNCLIDLCVNLDLLEKACQLLELGLQLQVYRRLQTRSSTQWSLNLKSLSLGAALTALHVWMNDLSKALKNGEELPAQLGINTGHGKHRYSDKGLAGVFESHLRELKAPFHEAPEKAGWFLTTKIAAMSWLDSRS
ncbi:unnamed protein product [Rhodiola kirilowii]